MNLAEREVKQWPRLGVRIKFGKHAIMFLLDVVRAWDEEVRSVLPQNGLWFARL